MINRITPYLTLLVILIPIVLLGQGVSNLILQTTSYKDLNDTSALKKEISQFTNAGAKNNFTMSDKDLLVEILPWLCTDTLIYFEKGNWIVMDLSVNIEISGKPPKTYITSFNMTYSAHHLIEIPKCAYSDIYEPHTCYIPEANKNKIIKTSNCRVFKRADKKRVYIYMIIGEGRNEQEITWVIQNAQYLMRVIDKTQ
jgi:hypothetical protein